MEKQEWRCPGFSWKSTNLSQSSSQRTLEPGDFLVLVRCCLLWVHFDDFSCQVNHLACHLNFVHPARIPAKKMIFQNRIMLSKRLYCMKEASFLLLRTFSVTSLRNSLLFSFPPVSGVPTQEAARHRWRSQEWTAAWLQMFFMYRQPFLSEVCAWRWPPPRNQV